MRRCSVGSFTYGARSSVEMSLFLVKSARAAVAGSAGAEASTRGDGTEDDGSSVRWSAAHAISAARGTAPATAIQIGFIFKGVGGRSGVGGGASDATREVGAGPSTRLGAGAASLTPPERQPLIASAISAAAWWRTSGDFERGFSARGR